MSDCWMINVGSVTRESPDLVWQRFDTWRELGGVSVGYREDPDLARRKLRKLLPMDRVLAYLPRAGVVGVGRVSLDRSYRFLTELDGGPTPLTLGGHQHWQPVEWSHAAIRPKDAIGIDALRAFGVVGRQGTISALTQEQFDAVANSQTLARWGSVRPSPAEVYPDEVAADGAPITEGALKRVTVNAYERDPEARRQCIAHYGAKCVVCGFTSGESYGPEFPKMIHVHHLVPLSEMESEHAVDPIKDLRPVCPNCHMALHRSKPPIPIEQLVALWLAHGAKRR